MASELPFEILLQIASFVTASDKPACSLACNNWKTAFQESLWENITFSNMKTLEQICDIVEYPTEQTLHHRQMVHSLNFEGYCSLTHWQSNRAFQMFMFLRHLNIESMNLDEVDLKRTRVGPEWTSVTSLKLKTRHTRHAIISKYIIEMVTKIPNLQKLDVCTDNMFNPIEFSLKDLNRLHKALPYLTSLKTRWILSDVHPYAIPTIPNTIPALYITTLDLDIVNWEHIWLYYFCYKYPNLRTLIWKTSCVRNGWIVRAHDPVKMALLHSIENIFPHLETVDFYAEDLSEWTHAIFWELLCMKDVPIKNLKYTINECPVESIYIHTTIRRFLQSLSRSLQTFSVNGCIDFCIEDTIMLEFSYCPKLVDIELTNCGISVALDIMLDNCIALRRFKLSGGQLCIFSDKSKEPERHGLRTLELNETVVKASVVDYISSRCQELKCMKLIESQIYGSISVGNKSMSIDMSYTHFKDLYINAVQFYSFNEQTNENVPINVLSLSRLNGSQEASKNDGNINAKSSVDHVDWYHFFYNLEFAFDYGPRVRKLSEEEVCKVIKYLQTSESKENTGDSEIERSIEDEVSKNDWEYDLSRGYVNFLCGSLPKYRTPLV